MCSCIITTHVLERGEASFPVLLTGVSHTPGHFCSLWMLNECLPVDGQLRHTDEPRPGWPAEGLWLPHGRAPISSMPCNCLIASWVGVLLPVLPRRCQSSPPTKVHSVHLQWPWATISLCIQDTQWLTPWEGRQPGASGSGGMHKQCELLFLF